jgi:hypothetical protein
MLAATLMAACTARNPLFTRVVSLTDGGDLVVRKDAGAPPGSDSAAAVPDGTSPGGDAISAMEAGADLAEPSDLGAADDAARPDGAVDASGDGGGSPLPTAWPPAGSVASYSFETSVDGWADVRWEFYGTNPLPVRSSTAVGGAQGTHALEMDIPASRSDYRPTFAIDTTAIGDSLHANGLITYYLWFPKGTKLFAIQPYVFYHRVGEVDLKWGGLDELILTDTLVPERWNKITHRVPADLDTGPKKGVEEVGIEWNLDPGGQPFKIYLDAVSW